MGCAFGKKSQKEGDSDRKFLSIYASLYKNYRESSSTRHSSGFDPSPDVENANTKGVIHCSKDNRRHG